MSNPATMLSVPPCLRPSERSVLAVLFCFIVAILAACFLTAWMLSVSAIQWLPIQVRLTWGITVLASFLALMMLRKKAGQLAAWGFICLGCLGVCLLPLHQIRSGYISDCRGRMAFGYDSTCNMEELLFRISSCMTSLDPNSHLRILDLRDIADPDRERSFQFSWKRDESVVDVLERIQQISHSSFTVQVEESGNPHCPALFPGSVFTLTLKGSFRQQLDADGFEDL